LSVHRAQAALHTLRTTTGGAAGVGGGRWEDPATVEVTGLCQLQDTLTLTDPALDSNTRYVGAAPGAILSGGTKITVGTDRYFNASLPLQVDLSKYNFSSASLGVLRGRGYAGGSACINVYCYNASAAELFFRPDTAASEAGARSAGSAGDGARCRLARWPNAAQAVPTTADWAKVDAVGPSNQLTLGGVTRAQLAQWESDVAAGEGAWLHGLWAWNWADSHRPVLGIDTAAGTVTVGNDDVNRDVNPIAKGSATQGGNVYAYNLKSELDQPGEYFIERRTATLWMLPPPAAAATSGTYHVSRLDGAVVKVGSGVANVTFEGLEIRYARGGGVVVEDATAVVVRGCTVANNGMMGVNITGGAGCGVEGSDVANNGDGGVILFGGDRTTLTPSRHYVANATLHHNQRWILNYAPDILLGGVGQRATGCEVYGSPQIGVFFQGNDHTLEDSAIHDAARQCSDCGAFYMGRDWTYRGNQIVRTRFSALASIWPKWVPSAVYLDDQLSSVRVTYSTFDNVPGSLLELGGGRHNEFVFNTLIGHANIHMDNRGGDGTKCCTAGRLPYDFLARVPYKSGPWLKYPGLADILNDNPCTPEHNVISNNVLCGGATAISLNPAQVAAWGSTMANNTVGRC